MADLFAAFWAEESTPSVRRMILDEAAGKRDGATRWDFNVFGLVLDFDMGEAVVEDLLEQDRRATQDLESFLAAAAAFGDDPSEGDGLTEAERHPPSYVADSSGDVQRLAE